MDSPKVPHSNPNTCDDVLAGLIVGLRIEKMYGEDALRCILERDYGIVVSAHLVHNVLSRAELLEKPRRTRRRGRKLRDVEYAPGEVMQMDVKHWKRSGFQYDIIDCCTRIKFKYIFEDYNVNTTVKFLELAMRFYAPAFQFGTVQMDNGSEFTNNKILPKQTVEPKLALPEKWLIAHNIAFTHIPPSSPHLNGRIERPHGVDKWRYKRMTTGSHTLRELHDFCVEDCLDYNTYRPHSRLGWMTPLEYLQSLQGFEHATIDLAMLC
ncbi:hypothetical protein FACS189431_1460 [Alphaproteobacteria bacterium]|nr:hypothetical protein FACS189431_1460 [Alphaproteobacteria bacterium]